MLTDGERRSDLNGVTHWYRVAGAHHRTTSLIVIHGGPGGNVYNFERTLGPLLEEFGTVRSAALQWWPRAR
jgi:proline iminopeptidase